MVPDISDMTTESIKRASEPELKGEASYMTLSQNYQKSTKTPVLFSSTSLEIG